MSEKKYKWHKVADSLGEVEFAANNIAVVDLDGKNICLGKFKDPYLPLLINVRMPAECLQKVLLMRWEILFVHYTDINTVWQMAATSVARVIIL